MKEYQRWVIVEVTAQPQNAQIEFPKKMQRQMFRPTHILCMLEDILNNVLGNAVKLLCLVKEYFFIHLKHEH